MTPCLRCPRPARTSAGLCEPCDWAAYSAEILAGLEATRAAMLADDRVPEDVKARFRAHDYVGEWRLW